MKIKELVTEVCRREGLKKQVEIGNVREIIGHLSDIFFEAYQETCDDDQEIAVIDNLILNGARRSKKGKKSDRN